MTTIAFRDGIMVSDSQETSGGLKFNCRKLFRKKDLVGNKVILGTAGGSFTGMIYVDLFGTNKPRPTTIEYMYEDEDFHIIIWDGKKLFEVNWMWRPIEVPPIHKFFAVGSGAAVALGAMHMGASAREAVAIACRVDAYTGGRLQVMTL
jgi:ATP-dependent protease HslVU (ClpYQ) peptidase subunit